MIHDFDQMNRLLGAPRSVVASEPEPGHVHALVEYDDAAGIAEGSMRMPRSYPFSSNVRVLASGASPSTRSRRPRSRAGGRAAADALARRSAARARSPAISVNPGVSTTDQRQQGFEAELKKYPRITYLGTQYDNDDRPRRRRDLGAPRRASELKGVFAMNVVSGTASPPRSRRRQVGQVKLVEFDAEPTQVQALKAGTIDALIAQYPVRDRDDGRRLAYQYLTTAKGRIKPHYGTGSAIITRANVNSPAMKKYLYTP